MQYVEYFDLLKSGYKSFSFVLPGIWFLLGGIAALVLLLKFKKQVYNKISYPKFLFVFICFWVGFSLLWTSLSFYSTYTEYLSLRDALLNNETQIIEGLVTDYANYPNDDSEGFTVNGIYFWYSPYLETNAFNKSKLVGGPIDEGKYIRIEHINGKILRLWIRQ